MKVFHGCSARAIERNKQIDVDIATIPEKIEILQLTH